MPEIPYGDFVEVVDDNGKKFYLSRLGNVYSCTCPGWKGHSEPEPRRTCEHLQRHRGVKAEKDRIDWPNGKPQSEKKIVYRQQYVYDGSTSTPLEPTLESLVELMRELDADPDRVDKYTVQKVLYFKNTRDAYLQIDYYRDPEMSNYSRGDPRPIVMIISKITLIQEEEEQPHLTSLVRDRLRKFGFRPTGK
jgi:hypothetical protein